MHAQPLDLTHGRLSPMPTLVLDPLPAELEQLIEKRRARGVDIFDEVWDGVLHMNPAPHGRHAEVQQQLAELIGPLARGAGLLPRVGPFNLGEAVNYRVPDGGIHRPGATELYYPTAALVIEIVSPGDETYAKLAFYAAHGVDEVLIVNPSTHTVEWHGLAEGSYQPIDTSRLIALSAAELAQHIAWPD